MTERKFVSNEDHSAYDPKEQYRREWKNKRRKEDRTLKPIKPIKKTKRIKNVDPRDYYNGT